MNANSAVNEIVREFRKLDKAHENGKRCPRRGREWTKVVCKTLSNLGGKRKYDVRPRIGRGRGEWLWDLCWRQRDRSGSLVEIPLVAESEWDNRNNLAEVKKDFEKLLAARALIRVMIFDAKRKGKYTAESIAWELYGLAEKFIGKPGDIYLLVAAEGAQKPWRYFRIKDRGTRQQPKLEQAVGKSTKRVVWKDLPK